MPGKQNWETPNELFWRLNHAFHFTIDGAADQYNHKLPRYIDEAQDAHTIELRDEVIFCNPPYANMAPWVSTFIRWSQDNTVVTLVQDKTDTQWFWDMWHEAREVRFLKGRVNFVGTATGNMHGAVVFVLGGKEHDCPNVQLWDWREVDW